MQFVILIVVCITLNTIYIFGQICSERRYDSDSFVCVCDERNCDTISAIEKLPKGQYIKYTSTRSSKRFHQDVGLFQQKKNLFGVIVRAEPNIRYQEIFGFGGTFTDSSGLNMNFLSDALQNVLMRAYYSDEGLEYSMGRVPMGATDYSAGPYTYDDVDEDVDLRHFQLKYEDYVFKLPYIRKALELSNNKLNIISTPWTAPPWMKTNHNYAYIGQLKPEFYQIFANYYVKFLEAYAFNGVRIWGITTGNEPFNGFIPFPLPTMGWTPSKVARWVANNLGPTIRNSTFKDTKIIIHDDQKLFLPRLQEFFEYDEALRYVDGVAYHWYLNFITPPYFLNFGKTSKKDLFLLGTEASAGFVRFRPVVLGNWGRAEEYFHDILDDLEYESNGWIDWNLALNLDGGPVYTKFKNDACVIINATANEFYKQPMFYAMGHFSKFLPRSSVRVETSISANASVRVMSFLRPDDGIVVIIFNRGNYDEIVNIKDYERGVITILIEKKSFNTILYW